jgi:hypothetical protein
MPVPQLRVQLVRGKAEKENLFSWAFAIVEGAMRVSFFRQWQGGQKQ